VVDSVSYLAGPGQRCYDHTGRPLPNQPVSAAEPVARQGSLLCRIGRVTSEGRDKMTSRLPLT